MPLSPQEEQELAQLKAATQHLAQPTLQDMEALEKGGVTPPMLDPIDFLPVAGMAKVGASLGKGAAEKLVGSPATKLADYLMQKAANIRNVVPGAGNELVKEGIVGTKGMMERQVAKALPSVEAKVQAGVAGLPGSVDSVQVASKVADKLGKRMTPGGKIVSGSEGDVESILERASDIAARGDVAPTEALALARGAERNAYKVAPGEVRPGIMPELGSAEGRGYKGILTGMAPQVAKDLKTEQALILAQKGLKKPENAAISLFQAIKGLGGAVPAAQSMSAQGLQKVVAPVSRVTGTGVGAIGGASGAKSLQSYLQNKAPEQQWTENDERELQELKAAAAKLMK